MARTKCLCSLLALAGLFLYDRAEAQSKPFSDYLLRGQQQTATYALSVSSFRI